MKLETLFLKCTLFIFAIPILIMCIVAPMIAFDEVNRFPQNAPLVITILVGAYIAFAAYFFVLFQSFKLLNYIDKGSVFSDLSVVAFKKIRVASIVISAFFISILPLFYLGAQSEDAPGILIIGMTFSFTPIVISVFSSVLQKLIVQQKLK